MISANQDALICDLAETYGIYDYRTLPATKLAAFAVGLRDNSRIKMHLSGSKLLPSDMLLAAMVDRLSLLLWMLSAEGKTGENRPKSILSILLGEETEKDVVSFKSGNDFDAAWNRIAGVRDEN